MSESIGERMHRILYAEPSPEDLKRRASSLLQRAQALAEGIETGNSDKSAEELGSLVLLTRHLAKALGHEDLFRALGKATQEASKLV